LLNLLGNKRFVTYMLYRGSEHGWMCKDFHNRCDNKGPTISLFKVKDGDCIGGYTKEHWQNLFNGKYFIDSDAMLFNLSCQRHFPNKGKGKEINSFRFRGPSFGFDELNAEDQPFNGDGNCVSNKNCS